MTRPADTRTIPMYVCHQADWQGKGFAEAAAATTKLRSSTSAVTTLGTSSASARFSSLGGRCCLACQHLLQLPAGLHLLYNV